MAGHVPISDCDICRNLSSHNYADLRSSSIPANIAALTGTSTTDHLAEETLECPICGTFYLYEYSCGFGEDDLSLRRATPTEAGKPTDVDRCRRDLKSPHHDTRGYAAQCLVEYYLSHDMSSEAARLVDHDDEVIRSFAEAAQHFYLYHRELH